MPSICDPETSSARDLPSSAITVLTAFAHRRDVLLRTMAAQPYSAESKAELCERMAAGCTDATAAAKLKQMDRECYALASAEEGEADN